MVHGTDVDVLCIDIGNRYRTHIIYVKYNLGFIRHRYIYRVERIDFEHF